MPRYFKALNVNYDYQLTAIGGQAPGLLSPARSLRAALGSPGAYRARRCAGRSPASVRTLGRRSTPSALSKPKSARTGASTSTPRCSASHAQPRCTPRRRFRTYGARGGSGRRRSAATVRRRRERDGEVRVVPVQGRRVALSASGRSTASSSPMVARVRVQGERAPFAEGGVQAVSERLGIRRRSRDKSP
jgi:hypothetical protein